MLFIKSQSNLEDPLKSIVLYKKELWRYKKPLGRCRQVIVTAIGSFLIKIDLDFILSITAKIVLEDYRSIIIGANFSAFLAIDLKFSYGLCYVLEFGLFVKGDLFRAEIEPKF